MDSTEEPDFLDKIQPPRLEDAGLEDCALPPHAIQEAFLKAALSARSIVSDSDDEDDYFTDPWTAIKDSENKVVGIDGGADSDDEKENGYDVVVPGEVEEGGCCVDGMKGLKIGEKEIDKNKEKKLGGKNDNEK